jgi:glycosyltransferase involved in cell wall biosynthesis
LNDDEARRLDELSAGAAPAVRLRNGVAVPAQPVRAPTHRGTDQGEPEVLFLARLHPCKQVLTFAETARRLLDEGVRARFTIVGPDGGDLAALQAFLDEHELRGRLRYEGALLPDAVAARLARSDVYVLPSSRDSYPMSVLEALAQGVATVCSAATGIADDLRATGAAAVVEPTPPELAHAIRGLVENPDDRRALGAAGARAAAELFGVRAVGDRLVESYTAALVPA